jgi:RNA polymerase sigma factor (sigma-70 family)
VVGRPRTDQELVRRARHGDHAAYAEVVRRHQEIAFRTAVLITRDPAEAEEAAQDAFVKAWSALGRFRDEEPVRPWLLAIVANTARDRLRATGRRERLALRAVERPGGGETPEAAALAAERRALLLGALARLREEDRLVIGCRHLLELSEAETAAALGVPAGTVKSRLARALERLREEVGDVRT